MKSMSSKEMLVLMAIVEVMFMDRGDFGEGEVDERVDLSTKIHLRNPRTVLCWNGKAWA